MANAKKLHDLVAENKGILSINLGQLRDELGFARIGKKILVQMSEYLTENNLGYFPGGALDPESNPEPRQWQEMWLFSRDGSVKAAVLDAFADPENADLPATLSMLDEASPDFKGMSDKQRLAYIGAVVNA